MGNTTTTLDAKLKARGRHELEAGIKKQFAPLFERLRVEFNRHQSRIERKPPTRFSIREEKKRDDETFFRVAATDLSAWQVLEEAERMLIAALTAPAEEDAVTNFLRDFDSLQMQVQEIDAHTM